MPTRAMVASAPFIQDTSPRVLQKKERGPLVK